MSFSDTFPGFENVEDYCKAACQSSLLCARASRVVDLDLYDYYKTFKDFREALGEQKDIALSLITGLLPGQKVKDGFSRLDEDEQMDLLKDVNASILENVSYLLDESGGEKAPEVELVVTRKALSINTSWNKKTFASAKDRSTQYSLLSAKHIPRPQFSFKDKIDNSHAIFIPIIKEKPNSIRPLAVVLEKDDDGEEVFSHPYECEIEKFEPSADQMELCEPIKPKSTEETTLVHINTSEELNVLCDQLKNVKEIALDLEHHSFRSFQGFTCLMQISTRDKDYIVDALALRNDLWVLNEVFTDSKIVKVLHGADMDILWLQRDFGLYIVNMFDTGQAARVLNFAHLSLAHLMKHYCNVQPDKQYQLADWRIRPLPSELLNYAREDTHYLLYIYDYMRNELLKKGNELKNLLLSVFHRSKTICLKKYKKIVLTEERYLDLHKKCRKNFNPRQLFCLKELYSWRDGIARKEDESYGYILPNHMLLQIAEVLPREHQGILACCNPIPPLVQQNLNDIAAIVLKANNSSLTQMEIQNDAVDTFDVYSSVDLNNMLHCPHDIHSYDDNRMHLPQTSENFSNEDARQTAILLKEKSTLVFHNDSLSLKEQSDTRQSAQEVIESLKADNKNIFERYLLTLKYRTSLNAEKNQATGQKEVPKQSIAPVEIISLNSTVEEENTSVTEEKQQTEETTADTSVEVHAINFKDRSHKRKQWMKKERNYVDVTDSSTVRVEESSSPKKSKTQETSIQSTDSFQAFDYSSTTYNAIYNNTTVNKNKKQQSKSSQQSHDIKPGPSKRRNKKSKSRSYNGSKTTSQRNWPSM